MNSAVNPRQLPQAMRRSAAASCCRCPAPFTRPRRSAHLLAQLELPGPCEIDGGAVQQVDTAGVQLVLAFALDCLERNLQYTGRRARRRWKKPSACWVWARCSRYPG